MFGSVKCVIYLWQQYPQSIAHIPIDEVCAIDERIECRNMCNCTYIGVRCKLKKNKYDWNGIWFLREIQKLRIE